ncbi:DUF6779 domain-containing protein [Nocardia sp. NPDC005978]|uniref:DUF6779 domain-containing protein n=1 Tax=Nocardia sp. NPDC005978 TaxID=3156725 RepID=UPI0033A31C62
MLLLLGLVASVFLVFSDNVHMVRVGLVAALWAAAIGALAATRYRRESAVDKAKVGDLQKVYHLQLEREVAARREYELGVESRVRKEVGADAEEMAALRGELAVLRESLQRLFDGDLPQERVALRADAVRVQELPSSGAESRDATANGSWQNTDSWDPWSQPELPEPSEPDPRSLVTPIFHDDHPEPPAFASPYDDPVTAETSIVTESVDQLDIDRIMAAAMKSKPGEQPRFFDVPVGLDELDDEMNEFEQDMTFGTARTSGVAAAAAAAVAAVEAKSAAEAASAAEAKAAADAKSAAEAALAAEAREAEQVEAALAAAGPQPLDKPFADKSFGAEQGSDAPAPATPRLMPEPTTAPAMGTASARRRRRSDEDTDPESGRRLSVAEIMANLRSEGDL